MIENIPNKILTNRVIQEELTDRIHETLGRRYSVRILEYLNNCPKGAGYREIDVNVIGACGSGSTARATLKDLMSLGWVKQRRSRAEYELTDKGRLALEYAMQADRLYDRR